ncbi:uncharacterized protein LOC105393846 [Plutella xylostella]|uniref:uncharacterized protein LOC105393846 n=1 Tax=Plutella xylostella TaxID=51655 RepID=UPI002032FBD1|nr:uncharacterized protein LOC105393846 [Plutella xylostella]
MGCFHSKKDTGDIHPNVFRVVNVDEDGADLWSGQLEVTETELVLYRIGKDATYWPLASLRRYGFEGEIFSFESGRRCSTGEGIFAFRCRRAAMLFHVLQSNIQLRNVLQESLPFQMPTSLLTGSPPTVPRQTLQATVVHRSSVDNGQPLRTINNNQLQASALTTVSQTPRSPSSSDILEVMPLYPRPLNNQVTNVYEVKDFKFKENNNNNNHGEHINNDNRHMYTNDFNRDLQMLRNTLKQETAMTAMKQHIEDQRTTIAQPPLHTPYINENVSAMRKSPPFSAANMNDNVTCSKKSAPLSPTLSNASEHYAQLSVEQQEAARLYMNMLPADADADFNKNDAASSLPTPPPQIPKLPDYYNLNIPPVAPKPELNSYANLSIGELKDCVSSDVIMANRYSGSEFASMTPQEEVEVNYAILDIETPKDSHRHPAKDKKSDNEGGSKGEVYAGQGSRGCSRWHTAHDASPATGSAPGGVGYTTIDFDKTVALTSVATSAECDGTRQGRHNTGSPHTDRSKDKSTK